MRAPDKAEADLDSQAAWILARVSGDLSIWRKIAASYRVDLFCAFSDAQLLDAVAVRRVGQQFPLENESAMKK